MDPYVEIPTLTGTLLVTWEEALEMMTFIRFYTKDELLNAEWCLKSNPRRYFLKYVCGGASLFVLPEQTFH